MEADKIPLTYESLEIVKEVLFKDPPKSPLMITEIPANVDSVRPYDMDEHDFAEFLANKKVKRVPPPGVISDEESRWLYFYNRKWGFTDVE